MWCNLVWSMPRAISTVWRAIKIQSTIHLDSNWDDKEKKAIQIARMNESFNFSCFKFEAIIFVEFWIVFFLLRLKTTFKMDISLYRYNASMMEYYSCIVFFFESISIIRFNHSIYWLLEWKIFISFLFYPLFSLSRPRRCQSAWRCFR